MKVIILAKIFNSDTIKKGSNDTTNVDITQTSATDTYVKVKNSSQEGSILAANTGDFGLFSDKLHAWIIRAGNSEYFPRLGAAGYPIPGSVYNSWSKTVTLAHCPYATKGLIICDNNLYVFGRGSTSAEFIKIGGNSSTSITSLTVSGDNLIATTSGANSSWFAIWLSTGWQ